MPQVRYNGSADSRSIDANAWKSAGVENQHKVEWNAENNFTAEVNEEAAKFLANEPSFEVVEASSTSSSDDETSSTSRTTKGS